MSSNPAAGEASMTEDNSLDIAFRKVKDGLLYSFSLDAYRALEGTTEEKVARLKQAGVLSEEEGNFFLLPKKKRQKRNGRVHKRR